MSRFQYGSFHDGPDPLAAPVDAGGGVDEIGRRLLDGQSLNDAFRDMFRDGVNNRDGLRDMFRKAQQRRKEESGADRAVAAAKAELAVPAGFGAAADASGR